MGWKDVRWSLASPSHGAVQRLTPALVHCHLLSDLAVRANLAHLVQSHREEDTHTLPFIHLHCSQVVIDAPKLALLKLA